MPELGKRSLAGELEVFIVDQLFALRLQRFAAEAVWGVVVLGSLRKSWSLRVPETPKHCGPLGELVFLICFPSLS